MPALNLADDEANADTENFDFREQLKGTEALLKRLIAELEPR